MADYRKVFGRIVTDAEGAVGGVSVTVNRAGTSTAITLKDNKAGTESLANPFETDANGVWAFFTDIDLLSGCDWEVDIVFEKSGLDFSTMNEMYENVTINGIDVGAVLKTDFDAGTLLYATVDNTPVATTPTEFMAVLSGQAGAAFDWAGQDLINGGVIFLAEQAAAETDRTDEGQIWVKTGAPNTLWFTDDAGTNAQLGAGATVVGTPVDNQLAIWKSASSIEGDTGLTWSGTQFDITGNLYSDGANVQLDGSTSVRLVSANFIALRSPANRIGFDVDDYMQIATTENTGVTVITHTGTGPTVTWTADSFALVGDFSADGATMIIDGSTSFRGVSAVFTSLESPANRLGLNATEYIQFATTVTTGALAITHTGSGPTVTWTADSFDLAGPLVLSNASAIGLHVSGACTTHAISISAAQTGSGLHIGDTWKLGFSDGAINIGGDATIAFGTESDSICIHRVDVSADFDTTAKYLIAKYQTLATSAANTGTNIWMGDYTKITVAHNTTDVYGMRGRVDVMGAISGNMMVGVMASVSVTDAFTCAATGGVKGVDAGIYTSGSGTIDGYVAAGWFDMTGNTINCAGNMAAVWARLGGSGYADYLIYCNVQNNNLQTAAICVDATDSAVIPVGIKFLETVGSITAEIMLTSANYIMSGSDDPNGAVSGVDGSFYLRTGTAAAATVAYVCTGTTNWSALAASGSDVTKVGTPVDNEIGVWTGDGTIEGDTNFQWDGSTLGTDGAAVFNNSEADKDFRVATSGETNALSINGANGDVGFGIAPSVHIHTAAGGAYNDFKHDTYSDGGHYSLIDFRRSHNDTVGTLTATITGDQLGRFGFHGVRSGEADFGAGAFIKAIQEGAAGAVYVAARVHIETYNGTALNTNQLVISPSGNVGIGTITFDGTADGCFAIANCTEPAAHTDNQIYIYSKDSAAGGATLGLYTESAVAIIGTFTPSHKFYTWINGVEYAIQLDAV